MNTPNFFTAPDYTPVVRMMAMQTRFAIETSQGLMKLAMMPWTGLPTGFGAICAPMGSVAVTTRVVETAPDSQLDSQTAALESVEAEAVDVVEEKVTETAAAPEVTSAPKTAPAVEAKPVVEAPKPVAPKVAAPKPVEPKVEATVAKVETSKAPDPKKDAGPAPVEDAAEAAVAMAKPNSISAPKGTADDLTALKGVGPKLAEGLNAEGIYTYAQIAGWTEANVAWIDENLPGVRGRASRNGWVAQAAELAG